VKQPLHFLGTTIKVRRELISLALHLLHLQEYLVQKFADANVIDLDPSAQALPRVDLSHPVFDVGHQHGSKNHHVPEDLRGDVVS
jgi:hypothetical protein